MSIDSDAQKDLALNDEDAEGVAGGRMVAKKKATTKPAVHGSAAMTSFTVNAAPLQGDSGVEPGMSQAELESDPDC
jgi:hypothetical protein